MDKTELNRQTALRFVAAMGANDPHTAGDCMAPDSVAVATVNDLVALSVLVLEVPFSASQLADRHRADVIVDDVGRLAVPLPIARRILDEHRRSIERTAAVRDERRQRAGEAHTANVAATRAKLHRRARAQAAAIANGDDGLSALAVMMNDETQAKLDRRGRRDALLRAGVSEGATFAGVDPSEGMP